MNFTAKIDHSPTHLEEKKSIKAAYSDLYLNWINIIISIIDYFQHNMGDSDDEYDRKRRDKFRGERSGDRTSTSDRGDRGWNDRFRSGTDNIQISCKCS